MATWRYGPETIHHEYENEGIPALVLQMEYHTTSDQMVIYENGKEKLRIGQEGAKVLAAWMKQWLEEY